MSIVEIKHYPQPYRVKKIIRRMSWEDGPSFTRKLGGLELWNFETMQF